jgi:signal transduction histidine kinase/ActR/RegA family two-component response regulator
VADERDVSRELAQAQAELLALQGANAALTRQLQERELHWQQVERRTLALLEANQAFAETSTDFEQLVQTLAQRTGRLLGSGCAVMLVAQDQQTLNLAALYDEDPQAGELLRQLFLARPTRVGEGMTGQVVASGRAMLLHDFDSSRLLERVPEEFHHYLRRVSFHSLLVVPIRADAKVIGALALARKRPSDRFSSEDLACVEDLASRVGLSLSRSRILAELKRELLQRQQAETLLQGAEDQLRQARRLEAIGLLAGGVAHDFNNLLTVILSTTALLADDVPQDHPWRVDLEAIAAAGRRAKELTTQLLAFSRKQLLQPRIFEVNGIVRDLGLMLERVLGEDVHLRLELESDLPHVKIDRAQLEQALMNLAANARDAMPNGGQLSIGTRSLELGSQDERAPTASSGKYVEIRVEDSGTGMDDSTRQRLFEPFFTTKPAGKGTGLGLSAVYGIVTQSGGHISVRSERGKGTTFTLYFPALPCEGTLPTEPAELVTRASSEAPLGQRGASGPMSRPHDGLRAILLVEDEHQVRLVVRRVLESAGYTVFAAATADEALELMVAHEGEIELLLSDVVLTHSSGPALAERLRAVHPGLKVLLMTGYSDPTLARVDLAKAQVSLIHKPFSPNALLERVQEAMIVRDART